MYDQYDDRDARGLSKFAKVIDIPEFVKQSNHVDDEDLEKTANCAFADERRRKYPIHTMKDAWLSRLWFAKNQGMYKDSAERAGVAGRIMHAADVWGLDPSYTRVEAPMAKAAAAVPLVVKMEGGCELPPLVTPRDFERAAIGIFEKKAMFTRRQRKQAATAVLGDSRLDRGRLPKEALEFLEKSAGEGFCHALDAIDALKDRAVLYGAHSEEAGMLAKCAERLIDSSFSEEWVDKTADILDVLDRSKDLVRHYGKIPTPEEIFHGNTNRMAKQASEEEIRLQNGNAVKRARLDEGSIDKFCSEILGEPVTGDYEEKLAAISALPSPDADLFCEWLGKTSGEDSSEQHRRHVKDAVKTGVVAGGVSGVVTAAMKSHGGEPRKAVPAALAAALATGVGAGGIKYAISGHHKDKPDMGQAPRTDGEDTASRLNGDDQEPVR
jgi:hypothetical protein